jgi:hypothetical protein
MPKLLAPAPQKIGRPARPTLPRTMPEALLNGTPEALARDTSAL